MTHDRNIANTERSAQNSEQQREHAGLRTLDTHFSARDVAAACHVPYGTGAFDESGVGL